MRLQEAIDQLVENKTVIGNKNRDARIMRYKGGLCLLDRRSGLVWTFNGFNLWDFENDDWFVEPLFTDDRKDFKRLDEVIPELKKKGGLLELRRPYGLPELFRLTPEDFERAVWRIAPVGQCDGLKGGPHE